MKAVVQDAYGAADVLEVADVPRPEVGDDEVLVRVHAAGVDRGVWHVMTGLPYLIRVLGYGLRRPKTRIPGSDLAGTVESVGKSVTQWRPGDEVLGFGRGTFAEYATAPADKLALKPSTWSFEQAASVPVSACTALQALRDHGRVRAGESVMILGASGGVGSFAVALAKASGAEVTGVCSGAKSEFVRALGADHLLDYAREDVTDGSRTWEVIVDIAGNRSLTRLRRALAPRGRLVIVGGEEGGPMLGGVDRLLRAMLLSPFVGHELRGFVARADGGDLTHLAGMGAAGTLTPQVDRSFALDEAADALRHLEAGRARGKLVLRVAV